MIMWQTMPDWFIFLNAPRRIGRQHPLIRWHPVMRLKMNYLEMQSPSMETLWWWVPSKLTHLALQKQKNHQKFMFLITKARHGRNGQHSPRLIAYRLLVFLWPSAKTLSWLAHLLTILTIRLVLSTNLCMMAQIGLKNLNWRLITQIITMVLVLQ